MRRAALAALVLGALFVVGGSDARLQVLEQGRPAAHHLLYLPNGRFLRVAALGNAPLAADLIYLWSIQYYGNFQIEDRYAYVDQIYGSIITELDPHYFDPYWIGALILSVETKDLDRALALLDKGFANNPEKWIFPYLAGWECASAKQFDRAGAYFKKAAAVPAAPPDVERLVAGMYQKQGHPATALAEWTRIGRESKDPGVRKIAENRARAIKIELDLGALRQAMERFRALRGRGPERLAELVREGLLSALPEGPDGGEYVLDPAAGTVSSGPPRVLPQ